MLSCCFLLRVSVWFCGLVSQCRWRQENQSVARRQSAPFVSCFCCRYLERDCWVGMSLSHLHQCLFRHHDEDSTWPKVSTLYSTTSTGIHATRSLPSFSLLPGKGEWRMDPLLAATTTSTPRESRNHANDHEAWLCFAFPDGSANVRDHALNIDCNHGVWPETSTE